MSEYVYGYCDHDSDVWTTRENGSFVVKVASMRVRSSEPRPVPCLDGLSPSERVTAIRSVVHWYFGAKNFEHGLPDMGYMQKFDSIAKANVFWDDLRAVGYWVPDRMFFKEEL